MTEIMPVPRNSHITVLRPPSIIAAVFPYVQPYQHRKGKLRAHKVLNGKPQKLQKLVRQAAVPEEGTHHVIVAATGITIGIRNAERKKLAPRNFRYSASASRKDSAISSGTPTAINRKVFPAARRKAALRNKSA